MESSASSSSLESSSSSSSSFASEEHPSIETEEPLPAVRDHSYLRGNLRILPSSHHNKEYSLNNLVTIELPNVVLFPGSSVPILISDRSLATRILNHDTVHLGVLCSQSPTSDDDNTPSWARAGWGPVRLRRFSQQLIRELIARDLADDSDEDNDADMSSNDSNSTHEDDDDENYDERRNGLEAHRPLLPPSQHEPPPAQQEQSPADPYIGRIGTIAKVLYTYQDEGGSNDNDYRPPTNSLFIFAIGVSRFQIVGRGAASDDRIQNVVLSPQYFRVQEIHEPPLKPPLLHHLPKAVVPSSRQSYKSHLYRLAMVSPLPYFVLQKLWLWSIAEDIREAMVQSPDLLGLGDDQESKNGLENGMANPELVSFSYWLATNLPLTIREKVKLLSMISVLERLHYIRGKVQAAWPAIHCQMCHSMVASSSEMFTVSGAEGTTGNYINRYGAVHQTITVRKLEMRVRYQGGPETQDSWFPGYSWTIMNCRVCSLHLGWKFNIIQGETGPNRPQSFFGLAAGNVTTQIR